MPCKKIYPSEIEYQSFNTSYFVFISLLCRFWLPAKKDRRNQWKNNFLQFVLLILCKCTTSDTTSLWDWAFWRTRDRYRKLAKGKKNKKRKILFADLLLLNWIYLFYMKPNFTVIIHRVPPPMSFLLGCDRGQKTKLKIILAKFYPSLSLGRIRFQRFA